MDKLHEVQAVKVMTGDDSVNAHLELGWIVLGVTSERDGDHSWFTYSIGWPKALPAQTPPLYPPGTI